MIDGSVGRFDGFSCAVIWCQTRCLAAKNEVLPSHATSSIQIQLHVGRKPDQLYKILCIVILYAILNLLHVS